jgi:hypothetical protein
MHKMRDHSQQDGDTGQGQDHVRRGSRNFAGADQRGDGGYAQEQRQVQKPAPAMAEMVVAMVSVPAMAMPVTAPALTLALAALFGLAFFERKFVAHTDIKFTHEIPYVSYGPFGRNESIIMESSNTKATIYFAN